MVRNYHYSLHNNPEERSYLEVWSGIQANLTVSQVIKRVYTLMSLFPDNWVCQK